MATGATDTAPPPSSRPTARRVLRWLPWLALLVAVVVALGIGTQRHTHENLQQRTLSLAGQVRCPVCVGETAAESSTPASLAIRDEIRAGLVAGEKPPAILAGIVAAYGPSILEKPQTKGIDLLLWILPVAAVLAAVAGLGFAFSRWRRRGPASATPDDRLLVAGALADKTGALSDGPEAVDGRGRR